MMGQVDVLAAVVVIGEEGMNDKTDHAVFHLNSDIKLLEMNTRKGSSSLALIS